MLDWSWVDVCWILNLPCVDIVLILGWCMVGVVLALNGSIADVGWPCVDGSFVDIGSITCRCWVGLGFVYCGY